MPRYGLERPLPRALEPLRDLATDLRWTWSHGADHVWRSLDPDVWAATENPWTLLQDVRQERVEALAANPALVQEIERLAEERRRYLADGGWFTTVHAGARLRNIAFFSMEFGLGEALPLYAGGLGVLAGDYLKAASDLGVPLIGIGVLYQEGYFRQTIDAEGRQRESFPYNDPIGLPIAPTLAHDGRWLHVELELPGRFLHLRVWQAIVGRARLYLLDSNDALNNPVDRTITAKLYGGNADLQFLQEAVLGIGGWRVLEALGIEVDICHLNEGHSSLAILERARSFAVRMKVGFREALWATRAGNVFTTHTAVPAAFDRFGPGFLEQHLPYIRIYAGHLGVTLPELLALGRRDPGNENEPFNLAYLAMRGSISTNAVSRLHGAVSRQLFAELYPRWPEAEVPVTHVTNGVHAPTWDSPQADRLWESHCGKERWLGSLVETPRAMAQVSDQELWCCRNEARLTLVTEVRRRLAGQLRMRGLDEATVGQVQSMLDPGALVIGLARRFTAYKRPTLLLHDRERLIQLITDRKRPLQIVVAGKAHPGDEQGKRMIREWFEFAQDLRVRDRVILLEDYDFALAQELVRGVDLWVNTPRHPWEACGTSGMKVLVNGGLNLSELDGWWAEAYTPSVGWALGDGAVHEESCWDAAEAEQLYHLLATDIVPAFYERDERGLPVGWLARVRESMSVLAPRFSTNRMVRQYVEDIYLPAADRLQARADDDARLARELAAWSSAVDSGWAGVGFGALDVATENGGLRFDVIVDSGSLDPCALRVELYAEEVAGESALHIPMTRVSDEAPHVGRYRALVTSARPASHFTPRIVPQHPHAVVPTEAPQIRWQR